MIAQSFLFRKIDFFQNSAKILCSPSALYVKTNLISRRYPMTEELDKLIKEKTSQTQAIKFEKTEEEFIEDFFEKSVYIKQINKTTYCK